MRMTLKVTNTAGVIATLKQYERDALVRVQQVMVESAEEAFNIAAALCAFRTGFMLSNLKLVFSQRGLAYSIGWFQADFLGKVYPDGRGTIIRVFYPKFVVNGTRHQAPQDNLTPAAEAVRIKTVQRVQMALRPAA